MKTRIAFILVALTTLACEAPAPDGRTEIRVEAPTPAPETPNEQESKQGSETDPEKPTPDPVVAEPMDCRVSEWSEWSACTATCDGGEQERSREVLVEAQYGGASCGELSESRSCNEQACAPAVNAYEVEIVEYAGGAFVQLDSNLWIENNGDGQHLFDEVGRDEWSVYLERTDGAFSLQLDLWTQEVGYTVPGQQQTMLYAITAANPASLTGWSATRANYFGGGFTQMNPSTWVEKNGDGTHVFKELNRDEWSVYLRRTDGAFDLQLDYWTMEVKMTVPGDPQVVLYQLSDDIAPTGWSTREVGFYGTFRQTAPNTWVEIHNGEAGYIFEEMARDEWSVYLRDDGRQVSIQLDLWTGEVDYSDPTQSFVLDQITFAR